MNNYITDSSTRTGALGGTLLVLLLQLNLAQLLDTALTAAAGAVTSFIAAVACKYISTCFIKRRNKKRRRAQRCKSPAAAKQTGKKAAPG